MSRINFVGRRLAHLEREGQIEIVEKPWKHMVVRNFMPTHVADWMVENYLPDQKGQPSKTGYEGTKGINVDFEKAGDNSHFIRLMKQYFWNHQHRWNWFLQKRLDPNGVDFGFSIKRFAGYVTEPRETNELVRGWHVDEPEKKYHILFYLGHCKEGGEFELRNKEGDTLVYPMEHNRLIIWRNTDVAEHQFRYPTDHDRLTISIALEYD